MPGICLDTNILVYADALNGAEQQQRIIATLARLDRRSLVLPTQVLGEFFNVMTRKFNKPRSEARERVGAWSRRFTRHAADSGTFERALDAAAMHDLQIWDALILATAADAGCHMLLSEDMQHGFVFHGVTVINPFADPAHPLLADALRYER
jgi:predicted nucleic acid-binding protein